MDKISSIKKVDNTNQLSSTTTNNTSVTKSNTQIIDTIDFSAFGAKVLGAVNNVVSSHGHERTVVGNQESNDSENVSTGMPSKAGGRRVDTNSQPTEAEKKKSIEDAIKNGMKTEKR